MSISKNRLLKYTTGAFLLSLCGTSAFASASRLGVNVVTQADFNAYKQEVTQQFQGVSKQLGTLNDSIAKLAQDNQELYELIQTNKTTINNNKKDADDNLNNKALEIQSEQPFWRLSKNQIGNVSPGSFDANPAVKTDFSIYRTIKSGIPWDQRDSEEKEILTAMGLKNQQYFYPWTINIVKFKWSGVKPGDFSTNKYWVFRYVVNYKSAMTVGSYAKLITGKVNSAIFTGINDHWGLCGTSYSWSFGYAHFDIDPLTESGELLFALPGVVAGKFLLDRNNPTWGYFPYLKDAD